MIPVLTLLSLEAPLPPPDGSWPRADATRRQPWAGELAAGLAIDGGGSAGLHLEGKVWGMELVSLGIGARMGGAEGADPWDASRGDLSAKPYLVCNVRLLTWRSTLDADLDLRNVFGAPPQLGLSVGYHLPEGHGLRAGALYNLHQPIFEVGYGYTFP